MITYAHAHDTTNVPAEAAPGCQVMLQKETMDGLIDEECGREVEDGHAGFCRYGPGLFHVIFKNHLI